MTAINTAAATVTTMSYREYITRAYLAEGKAFCWGPAEK